MRRTPGENSAVLEQMGPRNETADGKPMPMKIEPWPGGRWYRDLGGDDGHFWGHVQAIKRPTLLEITGPLFASSPLVSNVQYWLTEADGGTLITCRHTALGFISNEHKQGITKGWAALLDRISKHAEAPSSRTAAGQRSQWEGEPYVSSVHRNRGADCRRRILNNRTGRAGRPKVPCEECGGQGPHANQIKGESPWRVVESNCSIQSYRNPSGLRPARNT
jgi:hypothetical protein